MILIRAALLALLAGPAAAQSLSDCDDTRVDNLAEPWADMTRTFGNGEIRVAVYDTFEPAATALHLVVIAPPRDELGYRGCALVSHRDRRVGFADMDFPGLAARYDAARGLILTLPVKLANDDASFSWTTLEIVVDQSRPDGISARLP